jgi:hypothetical protein
MRAVNHLSLGIWTFPNRRIVLSPSTDDVIVRIFAEAYGMKILVFPGGESALRGLPFCILMAS